MRQNLKKLRNIFTYTFLSLVGIWILFALLFDISMIVVHYTNPELETKIGNEITWKIDGRFANDPNNIWYTANK